MKTLEKRDIIFADDIDTNGNEVSGYLWATDALVERTGWKKTADDDQINFYPVYNFETGNFKVEVSAYTNGEPADMKPLDLTEYEMNLIKEGFISYCKLMGSPNVYRKLISDIMDAAERLSDATGALVSKASESGKEYSLFSFIDNIKNGYYADLDEAVEDFGESVLSA